MSCNYNVCPSSADCSTYFDECCSLPCNPCAVPNDCSPCPISNLCRPCPDSYGCLPQCPPITPCVTVPSECSKIICGTVGPYGKCWLDTPCVMKQGCCKFISFIHKSYLISFFIQTRKKSPNSTFRAVFNNF